LPRGLASLYKIGFSVVVIGIVSGVIIIGDFKVSRDLKLLISSVKARLAAAISHNGRVIDIEVAIFEVL